MRPAKNAQRHKDELLTGLQQVRRQLLAAAAAVPLEQQNTPFLGTWSVNDLVAHLAGWDYTNLDAIRAILTGRLPDFYNRYDTDWHTYNAELVARHKCDTLAETLVGAEASHTELMTTLHELSAEDILRDHGIRSPRGRRVTIQMLLAAETSDERAHVGQLVAFART